MSKLTKMVWYSCKAKTLKTKQDNLQRDIKEKKREIEQFLRKRRAK